MIFTTVLTTATVAVNVAVVIVVVDIENFSIKTSK